MERKKVDRSIAGIGIARIPSNRAGSLGDDPCRGIRVGGRRYL